MDRTYTTGQLAKKADVNIQTIRFYEKKGLIDEPMRTSSGYRQYSDIEVTQVHFIKNAQKLGFNLREIKELLSMSLETKAQCQKVKNEIGKKKKQIKEKIEQLQLIQRALNHLENKCAKGGMKEKCPILTFLYED
ncbi:MAG: Mercuric resistance operon regulatory protein [Chlamydiae bacterium]|nr:Mercuric resistance operon regulatory protein [Chlamydiota bacterium]